jgi:hypothetical protein
MGKQIYALTNGLIQMNRLLLFILIFMPISFKLSSPGLDSFQIFNRLLSSLGFFFFLGWIYSIGYKANLNLISNGIQLKSYKYFMQAILLSTISLVALIIIAKGSQTNWYEAKIYYVTPFYLVIIFILFLVIATLISSMTLVSVELKRVAKPKEYLSTFLLMIFTIIGLWTIQSRIQKI